MKTKHHLFTYPEVRDKIVQIFGEPETDEEHINIQREAERNWKKMPQLEVEDKWHKRIHKFDNMGIIGLRAECKRNSILLEAHRKKFIRYKEQLKNQEEFYRKKLSLFKDKEKKE